MIPFLVYCLAVGAVAVPKTNVILALLCRKNLSKDVGLEHKRLGLDDICASPAVHTKMGRFVGYGNMLSGILCAISSPQLGRLSDRFGRKPFIAFSALGMFSGDLISVVASWFPDKISVYWILLEFIIGGLTGAFLTTTALIQAYATDLVPSEKRASVFSRLHACMYVGLALGPAIGALHAKTVDNKDMLSIFYIAGACHGLFILYVLLALPESVGTVLDLPKPASHNVTRRQNQSTPCNFRRCKLVSLAILRTPHQDPAVVQNDLLGLATIDALSFGMQIGLPSMLVLFSEYKLHWRTFEASLLLSAINVSRATILALLLPLVIKFICAYSSPEGAHPTTAQRPKHTSSGANITIIRISLFLALLAYLGLANSAKALPFIISSITTAAAAPVSALAQSSMTVHVPADRIGELFGVISLLHAVARALIPALMFFVYSWTLQSVSTAVFWGMAGLSGGIFMAAIGLESQCTLQSLVSDRLPPFARQAIAS